MAVSQMDVSMQAPHSSLSPPAPDPEVAATAKRRQFSSHDKRRILAAADRCTEVGEIGALLRREGLYSSQLATGRKPRAATERAGLEPQKRGRKADPPPSPKPGCAGSWRPPRPASMSKKTLYLTRAAHGRGAGGAILMSALHVLAPEIGLAPRVRGLAYQPGRNLSSRRSSPPAEFAEAPHASVPRTPRIQRVRERQALREVL